MAEDLKDVLARFDAYADHDEDNVEDANDDLRFLSGEGQWDDNVRQARETSGRPVVTVNRMIQFSNQIAGDLRQSQPAVEIVPADTATSEDQAAIASGLIRQIEQQSNATGVYSWGGKCAIDCGIGHWQIVTEFSDDTTFNQDIRIKRIVDPLSVTWDSSASELDRSDATECFVSEMWTYERFKATFKGDKGKELPDDFPAPTDSDYYERWYSAENKTVRIASQWRKVPVRKIIGLDMNGRVIELTQEEAARWQANGIGRVRVVDSHRVTHRLVSGSEFLSDEQDWVGKYIPVIPVIGNEISVNGRLKRFGIIRHAKDSQRLYNYFRATQAELVGTQPKAPYLMTPGMIAGHEELWARANATNVPYLLYNPDEQAPGATPRREQPPVGSQAMYEELRVAEADMYGTTGIYPTSLGAKSNETSGRAINARQREADTGTFVYFDNFQRSMDRNARVLIDLIPRVYDADRHVRILGADGAESLQRINAIEFDPLSGERRVINDMSAAQFDVRVKVGASFASKREQEREALTALMQAQPQLMQVMGDMYFESMDFPNSRKLSARIKKTMPQELVGEGGAQGPQASPEAMQMQQHMMAAQAEGIGYDVALKAANVQKANLENMHKAADLGMKMVPDPQPEQFPA